MFFIYLIFIYYIYQNENNTLTEIDKLLLISDFLDLLI